MNNYDCSFNNVLSALLNFAFTTVTVEWLGFHIVNQVRTLVMSFSTNWIHFESMISTKLCLTHTLYDFYQRWNSITFNN